MRCPSITTEVQSLTGRVATLNRFISKVIEKCLPFFDALKGNKRFQWDDKCKQAFRALKEYLGKPPLLSKPVDGELLFLYLVVSESAILGALIREEEKIQWLVYYISKQLIDAPKMEKLALALLNTSQKLRLYFHSHAICMLTYYPLRYVLQKLDASSHLLKCSIELSQFDIEFTPWPAIKGQAFANFIVEFMTHVEKRPEEAPTIPNAKIPKSGLYVDGSSNEEGLGAGLYQSAQRDIRCIASLDSGSRPPTTKLNTKH